MKYSDKELIDTAKAYDSLRDFRMHEFSKYKLLKRRGLFEEATAHMSRVEKQRYNHSKALELASKYGSRSECRATQQGLWQYLWRHGLLEQAYGPLERTYWEHETAIEAAANYRNRSDCHEKANGLFKYLRRHGLLQECYGDPIPPMSPEWTIDLLKAIASDCTHKADMRRRYPNAYSSAEDRGLLSKLFEHHETFCAPLDMVYVIMFADRNTCKIGTCSYQKELFEPRYLEVLGELRATTGEEWAVDKVIRAYVGGYRDGFDTEQQLLQALPEHSFDMTFDSSDEYRRLNRRTRQTLEELLMRRGAEAFYEDNNNGYE